MNARVLLVEDDARLAAMVSEYLGAAGFELAWVNNGAGALERLARQSYDALVLDLTLPDMDGLDVLSLAALQACLVVFFLHNN